MIDKFRKGGYAYNRPFYDVDPNAAINAGMVAFLVQSGTSVLATVAASGTVPVGVFWKDHNTSWVRTTIERKAFSSTGTIQLGHAPLTSASHIRVTGTGGTIYTQGVDYTVAVTNAVVTRVAGGAITAGQTVDVWYEYSIPASKINYAGQFQAGGQNYDRIADDTLGPGSIAIAAGWGIIFTDQFDEQQTYAVNDALRSNSDSKWTSATTAYPVCGRCVFAPTATYPFLGVEFNCVLT